MKTQPTINGTAVRMKSAAEDIDAPPTKRAKVSQNCEIQETTRTKKGLMDLPGGELLDNGLVSMPARMIHLPSRYRLVPRAAIGAYVQHQRVWALIQTCKIIRNEAYWINIEGMQLKLDLCDLPAFHAHFFAGKTNCAANVTFEAYFRSERDRWLSQGVDLLSLLKTVVYNPKVNCRFSHRDPNHDLEDMFQYYRENPEHLDVLAGLELHTEPLRPRPVDVYGRCLSYKSCIDMVIRREFWQPCLNIGAGIVPWQLAGADEELVEFTKRIGVNSFKGLIVWTSIEAHAT
ncbi:hypothetical protein EJ04DRAFT_593043 [Polyplosphaeria fusca]|uniref:Uncharacterized protein n=1 Tax=Polyplosphaeria fusca TaxID=682080 RepID=A0A9P4R672_9PLEO|nr:hypothetical protein EJ04DRAFT_593043 [Polyplosphaeria fusca]